MKPFIKYSGAKFCRINELKSLFPQTYNNVFIPFLGGGSFLTAFNNKNIQASDINPDIINLFAKLLTSKEELKSNYEIHHALLKVGKADYYNQVKKDFNLLHNPADYLFLTRTCYSGLTRYNSKNEFNVSFHHSRNGIEPVKLFSIIDSWYELITVKNKANFAAEDYTATIENTKACDFVIADPPYIGTKGQYQNSSFSFKLFADILNNLSNRNVQWLICLDHDSDLVKLALPNLKGRFFSTTPKRSSLPNLKHKASYKTDTIIVNYL